MVQASTCSTVDLSSVGRIGREHATHIGSAMVRVSHADAPDTAAEVLG
jgi:hypothetical protein